MTVKQIFQIVVPPPRRPVTVWSAAPLIGFLMVFAAVCLLLDLLDVLMYSAPAAFWLVVIVPWMWWTHTAGYSGLAGLRSLFALLIRLSLVGVFIILLAQPRAVRKHDGVAVIFVLDLSMSIGKQVSEQAMEYVARLAFDKPGEDQAGVIMFGRNAAVELPPSKGTLPLDEGLTMTLQVDRDGTNLEGALSLAAAVLPEDYQKRIVLISDGVQTEGALSGVLDDLKSRQIPVDVFKVGYQYDDEVWVERLELPRNVKVGETYEASVIVSSLRDGEGELVLLENGRPIIDPQPVQYSAGKNRYTIPIKLREPGYYEYTVLIQPQNDEADNVRDHIDANNKAISYLLLKGEGKVLVVYDPQEADDGRDWLPLVQTLRKEKRSVELQSAYEFATDPLSLLAYDCIVFVDAPADAFVASQFSALRDAVRNQGSGFVMVGGENSFGPGGFHNTEVEQILPVTMDVTQRRVLPKGALVIILHTCEFPQGNDWGKKITKQAIKVLGKQDEVGVLVYDWNGGEQWLFQLTPAAEYNRLSKLINAAQIGDMPTFGGTMNMALNGLNRSDAATKHIIIISDGDASAPNPKILQGLINGKITVSTVAIYPHGNTTTSVATMRSIAQVTGGNFYWPKNPNRLPSIFIKEAKTLKRSMIQNITFTPAVPEVGIPSSVLKGIDAMPPLHGYVITTLKPAANLVLAVPDSEDDDPVLAIWRTGLGKTAAFTSDFSANWGRDWLGWEKFNAFAKQLIIDVSRARKQGHLRMATYAGSGQGVIEVDDYAPNASFLEVTAKVAGPGKSTHLVDLKQVSPRRYMGKFPLAGQGRYQVMSVGVGVDREERVHGGFVVPYSQEYLRFRADPIALDQIMDKTGGQELTGEEEGEAIFGKDRRSTKSDRPIDDWFLIVLACLVPLDVALRRVQIDWNLFRAKTHAPSDETFSQLLRTKRSVRREMQQQEQAPLQGELLSDEQRAALADPEAKAQSPGAAEPEPSESTTERLLAARRKMRDKDDE